MASTLMQLIDDIFSPWSIDKNSIGSFIELANNYHPTIKFTAEISDIEITFLDTCIYKGYRFEIESILDVRTHFKPTESFQYTEFSSLRASGKTELTLQRKRLKITLGNSNESYERGVIQITFQRRFFQKLNSAKDHRRYKINKRRTNDFYRL